MNTPQELDEILDKYYAPIKLPDVNRKPLVRAIEAYIAELVNDVIGWDDTITPINQQSEEDLLIQLQENANNNLRAKQRANLKKLLGEGN